MAKKKGIIAAIIIAAAVVAALLLWKFVFSEKTKSSDATDAAYVVSVAQLSGKESVGALNRFSGVVESQEVWSVDQNQESTIKEIFVKVGQEVKKGDKLFEYDVEKFKSDKEQEQIELERMNNELETLNKALEELQAEQKKAAASEQSDYTIRIQDVELQKKQKELDIRSKTISIGRLDEAQVNSVVTSEIDGVVRTINDGSSDYDYSSDSNAFITIMRTGDLRVKGTINEQNIGQLTVGSPVVVHSRVDQTTWPGKISEINTDQTAANQSDSYYGGGDSGSSNYNFFVELGNTEGLMIGQHVYLEMDYGQTALANLEGTWIPVYYVDYTDEGDPFVWADDGGKLTRKTVTLGEEDIDLMLVEIKDGLTDEDKLAYPDETVTEGMPTMGEDAA